MTTPRAVGIGFPKAATTFLSDVLAQHPEVCFSSRKETHFFEQNETRDLTEEETSRRYGEFFAHFDPAVHRLPMEWTVTYITEEVVLDRMRAYFDDGMRFLISSRDPVRSVLSSYFYHRTISNDLHAARLSQAECLDQRPDVYIAPYLLGRNYRWFRDRFPTNPVIVIPQAALRQSKQALFDALFQELGLNPSTCWQEIDRSNVPYPYRSWRMDKLIRWTLVQLYGNRKIKTLYSRPDAEKPPLMRFLHRLNLGQYKFEPGIEDRLKERLLPDFADFVENVSKDPNTIVLGSQDDLSEGL